MLICFHQTIRNLAFIFLKFSICLEIFYPVYFFLFYFTGSFCKNIYVKLSIIIFFPQYTISSSFIYFYYTVFFFFFSLVFLGFLTKQTQFNPNHTHSNLNRQPQPLFLNQNPHIQITENSSQDTTKQNIHQNKKIGKIGLQNYNQQTTEKNQSLASARSCQSAPKWKIDCSVMGF